MKQKLLLNWIWDWIWLRVRVWFRVRGFFSNCDAYQFFHVFHLVIHFFYCLQHRICFKRNMYFGPRVFRVLVFFLSISSCYRGFYSLSKNWLRQSPLKIPSDQKSELTPNLQKRWEAQDVVSKLPAYSPWWWLRNPKTLEVSPAKSFFWKTQFLNIFKYF